MNYETSYGHSHTVAAIMAAVYLRNSKMQRRQGYFFLEGGEDLSLQGGFDLLTVTGFTVPCGKMEFRFGADGSGMYSIGVFDKSLHDKGPLVIYRFTELILSDITSGDAFLRVMKRMAAIEEKAELGEDLVLPLSPTTCVPNKENDILGYYRLGGTIVKAEFLEALFAILEKNKE